MRYKGVTMSSRTATVGMRAPIGLALAVFLITAALAADAPGAEGGAVTVTGTVSTRRSDGTHGHRQARRRRRGAIRLDADTRITACSPPGARVTVRYVAADGQNLRPPDHRLPKLASRARTASRAAVGASASESRGVRDRALF